MKGIAKMGVWIVALGLLFAVRAAAQPPQTEGQGRAGMRGGGGFMADQIMGFLALDEKMGVTDDQILKLRKVLKEARGKQQQAMQEMREGGGDPQEAREKMMALRGEMLQGISALLNAQQVEMLKEYMQRSPAGGREGRRPREGGGGGQ